MTTATTQQQQQQQQPVPPPPPPVPLPSSGPTDADLIAAAVGALGAAITVPAMVALLTKLYIQAGINKLALHATVQTVMSMPPEVTGIAGSATAQVHRLNQVRRAQMFLSMARRLTGGMRSAHSEGRSELRALLDGVERERRYFGMHREAMWSRAKAAMAVDMAAMEHGLLLGWHAHDDDRTTKDCRDADGNNFRADAMPLIGFPGAVHTKCRCTPVRPYPGAPLLPSAAVTSPRSALKIGV